MPWIIIICIALLVVCFSYLATFRKSFFCYVLDILFKGNGIVLLLPVVGIYEVYLFLKPDPYLPPKDISSIFDYWFCVLCFMFIFGISVYFKLALWESSEMHYHFSPPCG